MATVVKVTSKGREVIAGRMRGSSPSQAEPLNIGWGLGTQSAVVSDIALNHEAPESRTAGTSSLVTISSTNDTYQVTGTITCTQGGGETIAEAALSDSSSKPFSTTWATAPTSTSGTSGVTSASYTPANSTYIQSDGEVLEVTAGTGTTSLTVTRAQNGSTATTMANGDTLTLGNVPGQAGTNATVFVHSSFTGLALNNNDSIAFTFQVQIQSS